MFAILDRAHDHDPVEAVLFTFLCPFSSKSIDEFSFFRFIVSCLVVTKFVIFSTLSRSVTAIFGSRASSIAFATD